MEFWKRNWEKISADTVSGVLIRGIVGIIFLIVGIVLVPKVVPKFVNQPMDNEIAKELIDLVHRVFFYIYLIVLFFLPTILNWLRGSRESKNTEWELKNENLKLENEKLKLQMELQQQNQQSLPDNEE